MMSKNMRHNEQTAQALSSTRDRFAALRTEAAAAGDLAQVDLCNAALAGDAGALAECMRVLTAAEAQRESER